MEQNTESPKKVIMINYEGSGIKPIKIIKKIMYILTYIGIFGTFIALIAIMDVPDREFEETLISFLYLVCFTLSCYLSTVFLNLWRTIAITSLYQRMVIEQEYKIKEDE